MFGHDLAVVARPCNQFGSLSPGTTNQTLSIIRDIIPGGGFDTMIDYWMESGDINGAQRHPVFAWATKACPTMPLEFLQDGAGYATSPSWVPVRPSDVSW